LSIIGCVTEHGLNRSTILDKPVSESHQLIECRNESRRQSFLIDLRCLAVSLAALVVAVVAPPHDLPSFGVALPHFPTEKRSAVAADDFC
jgi:hypothetical protein